MKPFKRESRPTGGRSFGGGGGGRPFGGGAGGGGQMHPAVCSSCGMPCEVPFRPTGSKPVLCKPCFNVEGGGPRDPNRKNAAPPVENVSRKLTSIEAKLDRILAILDEEA